MKGTYTLLIKLPRDREIKIGALGEIMFREGGYAYVGSGLKSLEARIERHLREEKRYHWHIDYFLPESKIKKVIYIESDKRKECVIAYKLDEVFSKIEDFGSSDCKCKSHLFFSKHISKLEEKIVSIFREIGSKPRKW
ncbi:hypothetical protein AKJ51_01145 [candidate division MSBL1 archaeon SCGC-AAA382A20]|uniref:GIY-YIG domain-containing protein n=1 Tax=candidate division MSBL1 archaeon SCGC-AAA382A20 TaxID=1698280 RepID=A0A133VM91_9EURY|nr:hypothetical protein AKJ51_01145 [candidate division MSBL1 archaeon SCGC-AAA382A20]